MKKTGLFFLLVMALMKVQSQVTPTPDKLWGKLFEEVQLTRALGDNKTFVDMVPQHQPDIILNKFNRLEKKDSASLREFVLANFYLPQSTAIFVSGGLTLRDHLLQLWTALTRKADRKLPYSSLLPLPGPYVVPGGRFREIYYWDSYFTMQGLAVSNRFDLIEEMLDNFKFLIDTYGHIPNGNRNYYLSRSQPPYFALMVQLFQQQKGDAVYRKYFSAMEKEYNWWMNGSGELTNAKAYRRVVKMPDGSVLNRYYDDNNAPRQESYSEDVHTAKTYKNKDENVYVNIRAGAESGWDFSSRWLDDTLHLHTIETTGIIPADLNSLLYQYEIILSEAAKPAGHNAAVDFYKKKAEKRRESLMKYCWDAEAGFFFDYDFNERKLTGKWSLAGVMPLFCQMASSDQAEAVKKNISQHFLRDGGVVTTRYQTGQQWDAPNGWAPLQFITVKGLMNYGHLDLARTIAERWMEVNEKVFAATGRMMEKYNVVDTSLESGGGEYPTQDGFGWTNGVYLVFHQLFKSK